MASSKLVTWRDGVHISGTSIWCDAKRVRDICFVSVASALRQIKHGQLIASAPTLNILEKPGQAAETQLAVPYGHPFTLGNERIELFNSGHSLGSASLLLKNQKDRRVIYAGAVNPRGSLLGGDIDYRKAPVLIVAAPYGEPLFEFPKQKEVTEQIKARCLELCDNKALAMLMVMDVGKALDTALLLSDLELPFQVHHSIHTAVLNMSKNGTDISRLPTLRRWKPSVSSQESGGIVLWPVQAKVPELPSGSQKILLSGRACDEVNVRASGADCGYAWSNQASHNELVEYIGATGAEEVYLTQSGDRGRGLQRALPNVRIEVLGPPEQLNLFSSATSIT